MAIDDRYALLVLCSDPGVRTAEQAEQALLSAATKIITGVAEPPRTGWLPRWLPGRSRRELDLAEARSWLMVALASGWVREDAGGMLQVTTACLELAHAGV